MKKLLPEKKFSLFKPKEKKLLAFNANDTLYLDISRLNIVSESFFVALTFNLYGVH